MTQAVATAALYRHAAVAKLEKTAWRLLAAEVLKLAAEAEARQDAASHILPLWLVALDWVSHPHPSPPLLPLFIQNLGLFLEGLEKGSKLLAGSWF